MKSKLAAILLILILPLSAGAACEHQNPGDPRLPEYNKELNPVPPDPQQPPELSTIRTVVITANIEDAYAPYRVTGIATDTTTGAETALNEPVAGGPFTKILPYETGHKVVITITVSASRAGSPNGYLIIKDGPTNKEVKKFEKAILITINGFTTKR